MKLNSNNISSNKLLSNLNTEQQAINDDIIDSNLSFKKFVVAFANKHLTAQANSDESSLENNDAIKPRQILSKLENHPDLINLLNKAKERLCAAEGDENLNALYEFNSLANNFIDHIDTPDYSDTIHSVIMDLNSMDITPLQRIEVFYLVLFHNFSGTIITDSEIETKNIQGGYKTPLSRYKPSFASLLKIYDDRNNEILKMSDYEDTSGCRDLSKREEDILNIKDKNNAFIKGYYTHPTEMFLGYLPEIKDYHRFIWEALDMLGDGFIDNRVTSSTVVGMDGLLEKVILDSEFGEHIIKQFYHFTKTNEKNGDFKSVNTELDEFINLLEKIVVPEKYRQGKNLLSYMYGKLYLLCGKLCHPLARDNFCPDDYDRATDDLCNSDKLHIWIHIKSFFYWLFNKKTYDDTYTEIIIYELKKYFCKICREALSSTFSSGKLSYHMRMELNPIPKDKNLDVIISDKNQPSYENKIDKVDKIDELKPKSKLAGPEIVLPSERNLLGD